LRGTPGLGKKAARLPLRCATLDGAELRAKVRERHGGALVVLDNGAELRGLALDLRELCAELRGLALCGNHLCAGLVELLAKVQSFAPPPKGIIPGGLDLVGLCGDGCGLLCGERDQGGPELPGLAVQLDGEGHPFRLGGMPLDLRRRTRKAGGVLDLHRRIRELWHWLDCARHLGPQSLDRGKRHRPGWPGWGLHLLCPLDLPGGNPPADGAGLDPEGGGGGFD
jgi:hypothetical protein